MIHKFHYKKNIHNFKHKIEVMVNDIVKTDDNDDKLYKIFGIHDSDCNMFDFGTCLIIEQNSKVLGGYNCYPISEMTFVEREFWDPDHF